MSTVKCTKEYNHDSAIRAEPRLLRAIIARNRSRNEFRCCCSSFADNRSTNGTTNPLSGARYRYDRREKWRVGDRRDKILLFDDHRCTLLDTKAAQRVEREIKLFWSLMARATQQNIFATLWVKAPILFFSFVFLVVRLLCLSSLLHCGWRFDDSFSLSSYAISVFYCARVIEIAIRPSWSFDLYRRESAVLHVKIAKPVYIFAFDQRLRLETQI